MIVSNFPYAPSQNPYQRLITEAMESVGIEVVRIPPEKWWPLHKAASVESDIIHLDWPHDWYTGKNFLTQAIKIKMYLKGLKQLEKKMCRLDST